MKLKLKKKLNKDWKYGSHKEITINAPGLVNAAKIFANSGKIVCGVDESVLVANTQTGDRIYNLIGHESVITCVDFFSHNSKWVLKILDLKSRKIVDLYLSRTFFW